jgi:hypothetical protein
MLISPILLNEVWWEHPVQLQVAENSSEASLPRARTVELLQPFDDDKATDNHRGALQARSGHALRAHGCYLLPLVVVHSSWIQ